MPLMGIDWNCRVPLFSGACTLTTTLLFQLQIGRIQRAGLRMFLPEIAVGVSDGTAVVWFPGSCACHQAKACVPLYPSKLVVCIGETDDEELFSQAYVHRVVHSHPNMWPFVHNSCVRCRKDPILMGHDTIGRSFLTIPHSLGIALHREESLQSVWRRFMTSMASCLTPLRQTADAYLHSEHSARPGTRAATPSHKFARYQC